MKKMLFEMKTVYPTFLLLLAVAPFGRCICPAEWMYGLGNCSYQIHCHGDVIGLNLPNACRGASNYPVTVALTLDSPTAFNVSETSDDDDLLTYVTTFRAIGKWPQTNLDIVAEMIELRNLHLIANEIEHIEGNPFYYLKYLEVIDLSHNRLSQIGDLLKIEQQPNKVREISLAYNAIENIPDDAFQQVTSLKKLDLSNNSIANLNNMTFFNLSCLEVLKLSNNKIYDLDGALNTVHALKHLYLRGNQIQNIDLQSLHTIYHLETFDVSANHLEKATPGWLSRHWYHFGSHSTCKINLSENYITSLKNATSQIKLSRFSRNTDETNVTDIHTELDLSKNVITDIEPFAFHYIVRLTYLDLSRNKLLDFAINPKDLQHVKYLNLSSNYITYLDYESFSSMNNLENLDLSFNRLDNLPDQTFGNKFILRYVNMSYNYFEQIPNLRIKMFHPKGGVLDLSHNGLSSLKIPQGDGLRLMFLTLRFNNISDPSLIELSYQDDLKFLDLSQNYIEELNDTSLHLPSSLVSLDLTHNHIMNVGPSTFQCVSRLQSLRLSHNYIETIEYGTFNSLPALTNLDLSYNNIRFLDSKMLQLESLKFLSLRFNEMVNLDYKSWISHKFDLRVNVDGNNFRCSWLATALRDFHNGLSKMEPTVAVPVTTGSSLEGIPCLQEDEPGALRLRSETVDERLLYMTSKILEAIKEQTKVIKQHRIGFYNDNNNL